MKAVLIAGALLLTVALGAAAEDAVSEWERQWHVIYYSPCSGMGPMPEHVIPVEDEQTCKALAAAPTLEGPTYAECRPPGLITVKPSSACDCAWGM